MKLTEKKQLESVLERERDLNKQGYSLVDFIDYMIEREQFDDQPGIKTY